MNSIPEIDIMKNIAVRQIGSLNFTLYLLKIVTLILDFIEWNPSPFLYPLIRQGL